MDSAGKAKRDKFLPEEDSKLRDLVLQFGTTAWSVIADALPGRNARQCRERWKHYLSSETTSTWSPEDDRLLYMKMQTVGPKWTHLATLFPGRTDLQVKNRWMQVFAHLSDLHLRDRTRAGQKLLLPPPPVRPRPPPLPPVRYLPPPPPMPPIPPTRPLPPPRSLPPTLPPSQSEFELPPLPRDSSSFGSRSLFDLSIWTE
jgi:hypothetical protein